MPKKIRPVGWDFPKRGYSEAIRRPSESQPCPVCGHPSGDCKGGDHEIWLDPIVDDPMVMVEADVYVDVPSPGAPNRPMTFLAFVAGRTYPRSRIEEARAAHGVRVLYHEVTPTFTTETK